MWKGGTEAPSDHPNATYKELGREGNKASALNVNHVRICLLKKNRNLFLPCNYYDIGQILKVLSQQQDFKVDFIPNHRYEIPWIFHYQT